MKRGTAAILQGDWFERCHELPANHFHVCATSPPYFALRSYLPADHPDKPKEIGSEPTPEAFIETMVRCFREVRRVLHPSGVLWVNLGDSYNSSASNQNTTGASSVTGGVNHGSAHGGRRRVKPSAQLGDGQLLNLPHRVAEALRQDGWIWRQTIVWQKKSPMPESCKGWRWERCRVKVGRRPVDWKATPKGWDVGEGAHDAVPDGNYRQNGEREQTVAVYEPCPGCDKCRKNGGWVLRRGKGRCTTAHEYVFVFSKSPLYFWDSAAFVEETTGGTHRRGTKLTPPKEAAGANLGHGHREFAAYTPDLVHTRNPRSVWSLSSEPSSEPHFAAFPSELARRMIQAATSDGGCCPVCGAPWAPMVENSERVPTRPAIAPKEWRADDYDEKGQRSDKLPNRDPERHIKVGGNILGYRPTCECYTPQINLALQAYTRTRRRRKHWQQDKAGTWYPRALRRFYASGEADRLERAPCRVLDPFAGTGTTLQTAKWMGRDSTGVELNPEYVEIALRRLEEPPRWWTKRHRTKPAVKPLDGQKELF